jgi:hypothetical protein
MRIKNIISNIFGFTAKSLNIEDIVDGSLDFPPHNEQFMPIYSNKDIGYIFSYKDFVTEIKKEIIKKLHNNESNASTPDRKYGYANINTLSKAICELPFR